MRRIVSSRQQVHEGISLLSGVVVGTVAILVAFAVNVVPFAFSLGTPVAGSMSDLGCTPGQCVNLSIGFQGRGALDPTALRISITPTNSSVVVNGTPGTSLDLKFFVTAVPHWLGNLGGSNYTAAFEADIVNPDGQFVGYGGPTTILPGATLGVKGPHTPSSEEYRLTLSYHGTAASVLVTFT